MRIAHVVTSFHLGGAESVALDLAARQLDAGCEVSAYSLDPGPDGQLAAAFRRRGVFVASVGKRETGFDPGLPFRLAWRLRPRRADIIHTHNPQAMIYGAPAGRLVGARIVHTTHGPRDDTPRRMALLRAAAHLVDVYVAVSPHTAEHARKQREARAGKIKTIDNGVDVARYRPDSKARSEVRADLGLPPSCFVVGTVGRLHADKNQGLLVRAMAPLLGDAVRLVIVGGGPELVSLQNIVAQLGVTGYVNFAGARTDVARVLTAFDVFALSSSTEGLPLAILEAMATALPVVSTAVGGIPSVITAGATGFLVPSNDEAGLREYLELLCRDPDLAQAQGRNALKVVRERYSAHQMAHRYLELYRAVCAKRLRRQRSAGSQRCCGRSRSDEQGDDGCSDLLSR